MHKTNCMQSIEQISTWGVFSRICPYFLNWSLLQVQEVFHVYLNKFEIAISHLFFYYS